MADNAERNLLSMTARACAGITLETALVTARQALASVAERAKQPGYYSGARTDIINAHADLRAALDMLVKAAGPDGPDAAGTPGLPGLNDGREGSATR